MKTPTSSKMSLIVALVVMFFIASSKLLAQASCTFLITNNFGCSVDLTYEIVSNGVPCGPNPITVSGHGGTFPITCTMFGICGSQNYDVIVKILKIGTNSAPNPQAVSSGTPGPLNFGPCSGDPNIPTACYIGYSENISWSGTGVVIY